MVLNSQIEIRVVTRTFPQGTFELASTIQFTIPIFRFYVYKFLGYNF